MLGLSLWLEPLPPGWIARPERGMAALLIGAAVAWLPAARDAVRRMAQVILALPERTFLCLLYAAGTGGSLAVSALLFDHLPRLDDGVAAVFQARIFASGHVTLPLPEHVDFFKVFGVLDRRVGHWCGMYPPGWPALLVPGVWLGATWLISPLLHGGLVVATALLGRELYGPATGRLAGLLVLGSPLLLVLGGEHLSSTPTAFFLVVCAWATLRLLRTQRPLFGALAGLAWGAAFLCRPLSALLVGGIIALYPLVCWRAAHTAWRGVSLAGLAALLAAGALAAFQYATTGDAGTPGHEIGLGTRGRLGFGRLDAARTHTVALAAEYSLLRLRNVSHHLLGWPVPFYLIALAPFLAGRARAREAWLLAPSLALLLVFATYWYYDMYYPSQYLTEGLPALLVLVAAALTGHAGRTAPQRVAWAAPALAAGWSFALLVGGPHYLRGFHANYGDVESVLPRVVKAQGITRAVLFMDQFGEGTDQHDPRNNFYATGFMRNDLALQGDVIYARNLRERNIELMRHYPGRRYYLYRFNRTTTRARLYELHPRDEGFEPVAVPVADPKLMEHAPLESAARAPTSPPAG